VRYVTKFVERYNRRIITIVPDSSPSTHTSHNLTYASRIYTSVYGGRNVLEICCTEKTSVPALYIGFLTRVKVIGGSLHPRLPQVSAPVRFVVATVPVVQAVVLLLLLLRRRFESREHHAQAHNREGQTFGNSCKTTCVCIYMLKNVGVDRPPVTTSRCTKRCVDKYTISSRGAGCVWATNAECQNRARRER